MQSHRFLFCNEVADSFLLNAGNFIVVNFVFAARDESTDDRPRAE